MREVLEDRRGYIRTYVCVSAYWCVCVEGVYVCIYVHTHARMCASVVKHLNILFDWTLPLTVALSSHIGNRSKIVTISGKGVATGFS